ncbi:outer membrane protein assembly factor BamB family protein [Streptomyces sp. NBC_00576]|uniref:outer membrane protein assembly factor BamB family protein n=1 Tax=Streptomyces sp. NBC_00576 TaxID=2903665 RepID=UPI002E822231|nr:PQQ-binding-like beta-propeller repeat protein [Streptomyces sp. NBC_00576]WUB71893.1 PQQ-binding-like beta-propeller repeat protein [Streptomyces sp. NBC_00576]
MTQPPSQPPQGPSQGPSQGGFGPPPEVPQGPPPGAPQAVPYGAPPPPQGPPPLPPAPPAPQPGYGPPQQPGPYAQQSGPYGAQPGPYGYAPAPAAPGYGYPGQQPPQFPGAPLPPPPLPPGGGSGNRNRFKGRPALMLGAAVAALLVIGGTVYAVTSGGGDDKKPAAAGPEPDLSAPASGPVKPGDDSGGDDDGGGVAGADPDNLNEGRQAGESKVLWSKDAPDAPASGADANGMWITDKVAVKAAYKEVFAFRVGNGDTAWGPITFPQKICAVTPQKSADDKIVVAFMSGASERAKCNKLQVLDVNTGAKGWSGEVADGALFDSALSVELTLTGTTLMVGRSQSGTAYDLNTGTKLFDKVRYGAACFPAAFAGGARLIVVSSCGASTSTEHDEVQELDPRTGAARWTRPIPKGWAVGRTYSVDPVVLYLTNKDKKSWNISTLKADGNFRSEVSVDESFAPVCGWAILERDLQGCQGVVTDAETIYLPTEATTGANEIVAINLATGKEKWRVKSPAAESMLPLKIEGGRLIAYVEPSYDAGGQVVSIPVTGGSHTPTTLLKNPAAAADVENGFYSKAYDWVDGRFYLSTTRLSGRDELKEKLMLAFGK